MDRPSLWEVVGLPFLTGLSGFLFFVAVCLTMSRISDIKKLLTQHIQFFKQQLSLQKKILDRLSEIESHSKRANLKVAYPVQVTANNEGTEYTPTAEVYNAFDEQKQIEDEYFLNKEHANPPAYDSGVSEQTS